MVESKEEPKSLLVKLKEESENIGLKLNIQKIKIIAYGPITSWQIDGETVERVTGFIFLGVPKSLQLVTAAMKLKEGNQISFLLERKAKINLDSILKSRDITFSTKIHLVKAMVFPVVFLYVYESWTIWKAEC